MNNILNTTIIRKLRPLFNNTCALRRSSSKTSQINIEKLENEQEEVGVMDEEQLQKEAELERKRNKSRLQEQHRNILLEKNPYPEPALWHHGTFKYVRRTYGRYGAASGVNPSLCWPLKQELEESLEYERVAFPFTISEMIETAKKQREEKNERVMKRQAEIVKKMQKLDQWTKELHDKVSKKENDAMEAKQRKERLIEEVRKHFGYTVDPRDDRFKEMLEKKEKEQKKAMKEARKKAKEEQMVDKLLSRQKDKKKTEEFPPEQLES